MTVNARTMVGPVGSPSWVKLSSAPITPASAPNDAERTIMVASRLVHCRAAAAGPISIAAISTTPTVCKPMTTATTISDVNSTLSRLVPKPRLLANSGSKVSSLNSL
jgi:hypothetical protein